MEKSKKGKGKVAENKTAAKPAAAAPVSDATPLAQPTAAAASKPSLKEHIVAHLHRYVLAQTHDGWCIDGIVEYVDDHYVCLAVPCGGSLGWESRGFVPYPGLYPYPYYPRGRFSRQVLPLAGLLALSLLPFY